MKILNQQAEIRLFLCGYTEVGLQSMNGKLENESAPMWILMKTGKIRTPPGDEHVTGLKRDCHLEAPFSGKAHSLETTTRKDLLTVVGPQPRQVLSAIRRAVENASKNRAPTFPSLVVTETHLDANTRPAGQIFRGAVLLPFEILKKVTFSVDEGFGILFDRASLQSVTLSNKQRLREEQIPRTVNFFGRRVTGTSFTPSNFSIKKDRFTVDLHGNEYDLFFALRSLTKFEEISRKERLRAMRESSKIAWC